MGVATTYRVPVRTAFVIDRKPSVRRIFLAFCIVLISACQVTPAQQRDTDAQHEEKAPSARQTAHDALERSIASARALADAGDADAARAALADIDAARLPADLVFRYEASLASLAAASGDLDGARRLADGLAPVTSAERRDRVMLDARIEAAAGRPSDAARTLMRLPTLGADDTHALADAIWTYVTMTPAYRIEALAAAAEDDVERGWWLLADALLRSFDANAERRALVAWQRDYPSHPAARSLPAALSHLRAAPEAPQRIALLVPQSGPLAAAGSAVRDGFFAAYFHAGSAATVRIYDSAAEPFPPTYERMLADGVQVIVGPLDKSGVSAANAHAVRTLPTLALNYLAPGEVPAADLLQFGLAIEDEARAISERLVEDRIERLALFTSPDDWSQRAALEIRTRLAGSPVSIVVDEEIEDLRTVTDRVGNALLVDSSTARKTELERILGTRLEFVPRRRVDLDAIVALTDFVKARALVPALAYHFAADIPLYGASLLVQGAGRGGLRELDGARVCQLPWRVYPDAVRESVDRAAGPPSALDGLYALGSDAYRLVDRMPEYASGTRATARRLLGATGVLSIGADGAFHREPVWAVVRNGDLVALPTLVQ